MKTAVIVPNWNGEDFLAKCIDSLLAQTQTCSVIVVDNGSTDTSISILSGYDEKITVLREPVNQGFAGGVNRGIQYAIKNDYDVVALFNNDAVAKKDWLHSLLRRLEGKVGIVTGCFQSIDGKTIDSTGDQLTTWGLPYPRGRGESVDNYTSDTHEKVFGASGGASIYSLNMLRSVGLFDEDFFAYYEDVDISYRAQLAGWEVVYEPRAIAYHHIGGTSSKLKDFTVFHTFKNLPMMIIKNTPRSLLPSVVPRFTIAYISFLVSAVLRGQGWPAIKGLGRFIYLLPKKIHERNIIQHHKKVTDSYISSILTNDLPENSHNLRRLRTLWWKMRGRK